jgi:hypothetical protein
MPDQATTALAYRIAAYSRELAATPTENKQPAEGYWSG